MLKNLFFMVGLLALAITTSCKKDAVSSTANQPAVVGYLVAGQAISIKVYQQKGLTDTTTYGALITGLQPSISDGSKTVQLSETATGTYTYNDATFLSAGKTYTLNFTYNNAIVSASTTMPVKTTGYTASRTTVNVPANTTIAYNDSIVVSYNWNNPSALYHVLVFKNNTPNPYGIKVITNGNPNFTINAAQDAAYSLYYTSIEYIGDYSVILFTVNKEYIDVLSSNANSSSQSLSNPPANVVNGFGIFTAMQADTIKLTLTHN